MPLDRAAAAARLLPKRGGAARCHYLSTTGVTSASDQNMTIQLGQIAPDFEQDSTVGRLRFHDYLGEDRGVWFSHPKDYTPVCTTGLAEVARLQPEWDRRNVKPVGLSVDPAESHLGWAQDIEETQGRLLNFPVIADADRKVPNL